ncbi:odorant receptor Or2-like [Rhagoletis pomonella]|uniref:odorant receptor Or2-like n=1 Tax=Rhagoletis pomonella TaxID=28610 RepID=UPI001780BB8B|nr:odorant receptor Or2-like [Rhagoletis pomonella]XP_036342148.1 odorant receptor Or2-like [Rhagoletis pomonella]
MVCFTAILRAMVVLTKQRKFVDLCNVIEYWYQEMQHQNDQNALKKLHELTWKARFCTKYLMRCVILVNIFIALQPIATGYGKFVADVELPGIDFHKSPAYEIMYLLQSCWVVPVSTCSYIPYVSFLLIFIYFGIFAIRHLQQKLADLCLMDEKDALESVKLCVAYHMRIIKFREDLEDFFSLMSLLDASLYCLTLCMMLVYTSMLTAGGFKPMNMNTFMTIMRTSYSFFSLLQSTM